MIPPLYYLTFSLLCSLLLVSSGISIKCNKTQYDWPVDNPKLCCDKCPPGQHMVRRPVNNCGIECNPCESHLFFSDSYNVNPVCTVCKDCNKPNMELESNCTATHDTVCKCKAGFKWRDQSCTECVLMPTTIEPTGPPSTTASRLGNVTKPQSPREPIRDTVWFLVIVALLCAGITLAVVIKIKPFLQWIRLNQGYILTKNTMRLPATEDEGVSKPVQEMCGKCDQPLEVCVKE
ncbi:tumor necrosis factor receptor superfamily member 6 [Odontesthes bonariensis]|uniref:tumor necrosis factor receptor superfamily member 6 n=1 Tax=Odontesthes bonariensis TaxID=219752 RepID=UPI003F58419C